GRFLEHSRVFYFANGGDEELYVGSADWMARNLKHRIEVVAPVSDADSKRYLKEVLLDAYLRDNTKARELQSDGSYAPIAESSDEFNSQNYFVSRTPATSSYRSSPPLYPPKRTLFLARLFFFLRTSVFFELPKKRGGGFVFFFFSFF